MELSTSYSVRDISQRQTLLRAQTLLTLQLFTLVGDIPSLLFRLQHMESIARGGSAIQSQYDGRLGGSRFLYTLVTLIEHGLDASPAGTGYHDITHFERAIAYQYRRNIATPFVKRRLYNGSRSFTVGIGFQIQHFRLEQYLVEQFGHANTFFGTDFLALVLTAPLLNQQIHVGQVFPDLVRICAGLVYLVDGKHHGHSCRLGMGDGLFGGRHHGVIRGNDDNGDIRHLGSTGTHSGESLMSRRIQESYLAAIFQSHAIGSDMLGDAAGLARYHVGIANKVEQRSLTMVYMAHHGNDRRTGNQVVLVILFFADRLLYLRADIFGGKAKFLGHHVDGLGV